MNTPDMVPRKPPVGGVSLLTLIALVAVGWAGSNAQETKATGTIAFVRGSQLWVMRADGSGQRKLTRSRGSKSSPAWSPEGRRIAYVRETRITHDKGTPKEYTAYSSHIFVISADGSGGTRLTRTYKYEYQYDRYPVWSPGGRTIAFEEYDSDPNYAVYIVDADGSGERRVTPGNMYAGPSWSPDGRKIAFTHIHKGAVYVMRPNGSGRRVLARMKGASASWGVAWSPDGRRIAFIRDSLLWVMNADGTRPRMLVDSPVDNPGRRSSDFAWSPDGRKIAFSQGYRGASEIFVVSADGSGLRKLTDNNRVLDVNPVWSPDGRAIAFTSDRDGNAEIYVMNADGSGQRNVSQSTAEDSDPTWSQRLIVIRDRIGTCLLLTWSLAVNPWRCVSPFVFVGRFR